MRVLAGLLFTVCLFAATPAYAADQVVVRFSRSADSADRSAAHASVDATSAKSLPGLTGVQVVTVPEGDAKSATRTLDNADGVLWAQPEHRMHSLAALPSDPVSESDAQWGLQNIGQTTYDSYYNDMYAGTAGVDGDFTTAWDRSTGTGQTIAVVDTGVDFSHVPDLAANEDSSADFMADNANVCDPPSTAGLYHGTHVAGIAAASLGVNETDHDITGGAPDAQIMSLRALNGDGCGSDADIAQAFTWAADHGVRVVNASLGGVGYSQVLHDAIAAAPNTLFVVAAGNDGTNEDGVPSAQQDFPCADPAPNVLCVAAVNSRGQLAPFSNYGARTVDVAAPGEGIVSYVPGGGIAYADGTSMATPYVSAAAALIFATNTDATPEQARDSIIATARSLPAVCGRTATSGIVDADAALSLSTTQPAPRACGAVTLSTAAPAQGHTVSARGAFDRGTVTWQWQRCTTTCAGIPGATSPAYAPQAADVGKRLRAVATAWGVGHTSAYSTLSAAVAAAPVTAKPTPKPTPTPAPKPAAPAPASPKLSLYKPHRRGRRLAISGRVAWSFHRTITLKVCVGRRCRSVHVKAHSGRYSATVRPSRRGRVVVLASVWAGGGFKYARAKRTVRF